MCEGGREGKMGVKEEGREGKWVRRRDGERARGRD